MLKVLQPPLSCQYILSFSMTQTSKIQQFFESHKKSLVASIFQSNVSLVLIQKEVKEEIVPDDTIKVNEDDNLHSMVELKEDTQVEVEDTQKEEDKEKEQKKIDLLKGDKKDLLIGKFNICWR